MYIIILTQYSQVLERLPYEAAILTPAISFFAGKKLLSVDASMIKIKNDASFKEC